MKPEVLSKFIQRITVSNNRKSKDVSFSLAEALEISTAVAELLADRIRLLEEINDLKTKSSEIVEVKISGGSLKG